MKLLEIKIKELRVAVVQKRSPKGRPFYFLYGSSIYYYYAVAFLIRNIITVTIPTRKVPHTMSTMVIDQE